MLLVCRERADRPFRCLDCQYRRELVRVYLTNVEQICRRFVEERRGKLGKLIEDKARWASFCAFWLGMDQNARRRMSREKADSILKVVVKHFFIEKEVTSTLVMDSLYSGLMALEGQTKSKKGRGKYLEAEELPVPIVHTEKDMFVLVDDVLLLLERAAMEPLPPKDEKGPQNRTKDGGSGEDFNKDSIERDERRLTELGRRTIEIFVLAHIYSKIEVAYQEAVALKRQEELIREEEAAWLAGGEQKAKRVAAEKEKKLKKKQGKQKRNNRKGRDKGRDEKPGVIIQDEVEEESAGYEGKDFLTEEAGPVIEKPDTLEDVSDVSDSIDCAAEILHPDSEDRDACPVNWDTDTSELHPPTDTTSSGLSSLSAVQNGTRGRQSPSVMDDSSSTCSTDSVPSVVMNGPYKGNSIPNQNFQKFPSRGRDQHVKATYDLTGWTSDMQSQSFEAASDAGRPNDVSGSFKVSESEPQALQDRIKVLEQHVAKKEEEVVSLQRKLIVKDEAHIERPPTEKARGLPSPPRSPPKNAASSVQTKLESKICAARDPVSVREPSSESPKQNHKTARVVVPAENMVPLRPESRPESHKAATPKPIEKPTAQQVPVTTEKPVVQRVPVPVEKSMAQQVPMISGPLSTSVILEPRPTAPVVTMVQTPPLLAHSVSAAGRLGPDPSSASHSYVPQSYRNAIIGGPVTASSSGFTQPPSPSLSVSSSNSYTQPPIMLSGPLFLPQSSERMEPNPVKPSFSFGMANHDVLQNGPQWMDCPRRNSSRSIHCDPSSLVNDIQNFDLYKPVHSRSQDYFTPEFPPCTSGRQTQSVLTDEFPHLDIINDLLDDEHGSGMASKANSGFQSFSNGPRQLNRQFTFPGDMGMSSDMGPSTSSSTFERTRSYHDDGFQRGYGLSGGHFDPLRDMIAQASPMPYVNGQIPNQWQMVGSDLSYLDMRNTDRDGHTYRIQDYQNLVCGVNGYTLFRPSNGH
ncbi:unnamed protein product [Ilex paraguariensis]|uniref:MATH domain-containing protein n=1 Tax=Ilex paraguariensis TaxID=185542 RepID=A0ABC8USV2_9AQUA